MKFFLTIAAFSFTIFSIQAFGKMPTYPQIFCTNDFNGWVGSYAIDISYVDARGNVSVSVSEHTEDANMLLFKTVIEKQAHNTNLIYLGKNFSFEMPMDNFNTTGKNMANIRFKTNTKIVADDFICYIAQNKGESSLLPLEN